MNNKLTEISNSVKNIEETLNTNIGIINNRNFVSYIDNEGNEVIVDLEPDFPERPGDYLTDEDSKKKTYMTKDEDGNILVKSR